jgi:hypothetical protein
MVGLGGMIHIFPNFFSESNIGVGSLSSQADVTEKWDELSVWVTFGIPGQLPL